MTARLRLGGTLALGQALGRGTLAVYTIVMVRELSAAGYGRFAYVIAVVGIGVSIADAGFARLLVRDVARAPHPSTLVRELLAVRAGAVLGLAGVGLILSAASGVPVPRELAVAATAYLILEGLAFGFENGAVGAERPRRFVAAQAAGAVTLASVGSLLVAAGEATPRTALWGLALASAVKVGAHGVAWRRDREGPAPRAWRSLPVGEWYRRALPFFALAVLAAVYYRLGVTLLYALRGSEETAPYAAAVRVFDGAAILAGVGYAVVSPAISRAHRDRPEELWALWRRMIAVGAAVALPCGALLALFAEPVAGVLFGARYEQSAGSALALLAPGMVLLVLQSLSASVVLMADEHRAVLALTAVNVAVGLALAVLLIDAHGSDGAAAATSLAELLSFATFAVLIRRRHGQSHGAAPAPPEPGRSG